MMQSLSRSLRLPPGYRCHYFDTVDSTNAEARRRAQQGEPAGLWVWAGCQSKGRGRSGRDWASAPGNLYASVLLRPRCGLQEAVALSLLAGVAAFDAVKEIAADAACSGQLCLKWPNDLMLGGAKLGGVLLESFSDSAGPSVVIGTGVNVAHVPAHLAEEATSLHAHGISINTRGVLEALATATEQWLTIWAEGTGFAQVRQAWLKRAGEIGMPMSVKLQSGEISGHYLGIDASGALRLRVAGGGERRITVGDVFLTPDIAARKNSEVAHGQP